MNAIQKMKFNIYHFDAYINPDSFLFDADVMRKGNNQEYRKSKTVEELNKRYKGD